MNDLLKQELRGGWLDVGNKFQAIDFFGMALGSYFIYDGVTGKGPQWLTVSIGAIMIYIHSQRFLYAPKSREGLMRLMRDLDITPEEVVGELPGPGTNKL
jgi:hypothetical protein